MKPNVGETWFSKRHSKPVRVEIKALFDDKIVFQYEDEDAEVLSVEDFEESFARDFQTLKRERLDYQINNMIKWIEEKKEELERLKEERKAMA